MEKLLKKYIQKSCNWEEIYISYYNVDGSACLVNYYTDSSRHYEETVSINIWDMIIFLNDKSE